MDKDIIKHLEMIQNVIARMSANSFMLKGWSVTLIVGILTLSPESTNKVFLFIPFFPVILFWGLDSYYLKKERMYRKLYNIVRISAEADFAMNLEAVPKSNDLSYLVCFLSLSEISFYLPLALMTASMKIIIDFIM